MRVALPILTLLLLITTASSAEAQRRRHIWDNRGWVMLGEQTVDGRRRADTDTFVVGRYEGRYSKLQMVVDDSDLELLDFAVTFGPRGEVWRPSGVGHYFRENQATRVIDLPGDDRIIQKIDVRYKNLPGGGKARVQIWGFKDVRPPPPPPPPPPPAFSWDSRGWTLLGETTVDYGRRVDRDRITVGRDAGKFDRLMLVVLDGDLNMIDMTLSVGRGGQAYRPAVAQYYRENTRTRAIDLPGEYRTTIHYIDFTYKNIPGGPRARVQVWAKDGAGGPPVVAPRRHVWDTNGWVKLGHQTVDGARRADTDTIMVGRYEGRFSKLTMVVDDSDLELLDFAVTFGPRGEVWRPSGVGHYFRENQRTRVIDLPGDDRIIQKIDLRYRNLPGGGRASVEIWGFKDNRPIARPVIRRAAWDNRGWVKLGEQTVDHGRRADRDTIVVGRYEGRFSKLTMVVDDDDLELLDFAVTFGPRGEVWRPSSVGHYFRENQRTRVIDLPGDTRVIQKIDLKYRNLPGGGRAKVEIWGFKR